MVFSGRRSTSADKAPWQYPAMYRTSVYYFLGLLVFYLLMTKLSEIVLSRISNRLSKGQATAAGEAMRKAAI